jgi:hypothetical protein
MNIEDLTLKQIRDLLRSIFNTEATTQPHPYEIGKTYFLRTVTYHFTGRLVAVFAQELLFEDCAWIPEDGRFADAVATGNFHEVEPFPKGSRVIIGRGTVTDTVVGNWTPPSSQK